MSRENDIFDRWRKLHPKDKVDRKTNTLISQWIDITGCIFRAEDYLREEVIPWHKGATTKEPDLVHVIADYGYIGVVIGDWDRLPIDIPPEDLAEWQETSGLIAPLEDVHRFRAGIAGCIPRALHSNANLFVSALKRQVAARIEELSQLTSQPIEQFTPTDWDYWEYEPDYELEGQEIKQLDRIFNLFEELWCFEYGVEELRMLMITETNPKFWLPNPAFYEALCSINSTQIMVALDTAEPKLKQILKLWGQTVITATGKPYHRPYDDSAPEQFWWRHRQKRGRQCGSAGRPKKTSRSSNPPRSHQEQHSRRKPSNER